MTPTAPFRGRGSIPTPPTSGRHKAPFPLLRGKEPRVTTPSTTRFPLPPLLEREKGQRLRPPGGGRRGRANPAAVAPPSSREVLLLVDKAIPNSLVKPASKPEPLQSRSEARRAQQESWDPNPLLKQPPWLDNLLKSLLEEVKGKGTDSQPPLPPGKFFSATKGKGTRSDLLPFPGARLAPGTLPSGPIPLSDAQGDCQLLPSGKSPGKVSLDLSNLQAWEDLARVGLEANAHTESLLLALDVSLTEGEDHDTDPATLVPLLQHLGKSVMASSRYLARLFLNAVLLKRDSALAAASNLDLPKSAREKLRGADLSSDSLFTGEVPATLKKLQEERKEAAELRKL